MALRPGCNCRGAFTVQRTWGAQGWGQAFPAVSPPHRAQGGTLGGWATARWGGNGGPACCLLGSWSFVSCAREGTQSMTFHVTSVQCDDPEIRHIGWRTLEIHSQCNPSCSMCLLGGFLHRQQVSRGDMTLPGWLFRILASSYRFCLRLGRCGREQTSTCLLVPLSSLFTPVFWRIRGVTLPTVLRTALPGAVLAPGPGVGTGGHIWPVWWGAGQPCAGRGNRWPQRQDVCPSLAGLSGLPRPRGCGVVQLGSVGF